jgi:hypothetical protein
MVESRRLMLAAMRARDATAAQKHLHDFFVLVTERYMLAEAQQKRHREITT